MSFVSEPHFRESVYTMIVLGSLFISTRAAIQKREVKAYIHWDDGLLDALCCY